MQLNVLLKFRYLFLIVVFFMKLDGPGKRKPE